MSRWLALVDEEEENSIPLPDTQTKPDKTPVVQPEGVNCRVVSGCRVEGSRKLGAQNNSVPTGSGTTVSKGDASPYGQTIGGRQLTWTGKVVSLADWRTLSEWERHGSTGRVWDGKTQQWKETT